MYVPNPQYLSCRVHTAAEAKQTKRTRHNNYLPQQIISPRIDDFSSVHFTFAFTFSVGRAPRSMCYGVRLKYMHVLSRCSVRIEDGSTRQICKYLYARMSAFRNYRLSDSIGL